MAIDYPHFLRRMHSIASALRQQASFLVTQGFYESARSLEGHAEEIEHHVRRLDDADDTVPLEIGRRKKNGRWDLE